MLRHPWPAIARTIWGDPDRYVETYFGRYGPEVYVAGDGARLDEEGYFWLLGRIDDVMNVAGHRLSTFEIESALVDDEKRRRGGRGLEAARHQGRGHRGLRHLEVRVSRATSDVLTELREHVAKVIGPIAKPDEIIFTPGPAEDPLRARSCAGCCATWRGATRSGDVTTLANAEIVQQIHEQVETGGAEE